MLTVIIPKWPVQILTRTRTRTRTRTHRTPLKMKKDMAGTNSENSEQQEMALSRLIDFMHN
jgi:hypothetical protein